MGAWMMKMLESMVKQANGARRSLLPSTKPSESGWANSQPLMLKHLLNVARIQIRFSTLRTCEITFPRPSQGWSMRLDHEYIADTNKDMVPLETM